MSQEEEKEALRKLIMIISDLRNRDQERYESHVDFMNETIKMIRAIESQMNKHWSTVLESLNELNEDISAHLDSLLTSINPKGLRETSKSLKTIMETMNKSVQSMNLEKVLSELKVLRGGAVPAASGQQQAQSQGEQPEQISASDSLKPPGLKAPSGGGGGSQAATASADEGSAEWVDPNEQAQKQREKEEEEEDSHLLKPSDFFK
ncbi:MAG: hypothetical protein ACOC44_16085 [Promethearchaeia archaeon]